MARRPLFQKVGTPETEALDCLVSNICGLFQTQSINKSRYFVTYIDVYNGYFEVKFRKKKSEVIEKTKQFIEMLKKKRVENQRCLDRIEQLNICRQNCRDISRMKALNISAQPRSMRFEASLPNNLWAEAVRTANYVQNRTISKNRSKTHTNCYLDLHHESNRTMSLVQKSM